MLPFQTLNQYIENPFGISDMKKKNDFEVMAGIE